MAETRYVAKTGSDASGCTNPGAPCLTVGFAVGQAVDGDTIQIGPGTYNEAVSTEKVLTFAGAGGGSLPGSPGATVIQGPAGAANQFGKTALELRRGGTVRARATAQAELRHSRVSFRPARLPAWSPTMDIR